MNMFQNILQLLPSRGKLSGSAKKAELFLKPPNYVLWYQVDKWTAYVWSLTETIAIWQICYRKVENSLNLFRSHLTGKLLWNRRTQFLMTFLKYVANSLQLWGKCVMIKSVNTSVGNVFICSLGSAALLWVKSLMDNLGNYPCSLINILHPTFLSCCMLSVIFVFHF